MKLQDLPENQVPFWYQVYEGEEDEIDSKGRRTGDKVKHYSNPIREMARISANTGDAANSPFGQNIVYDKSISTVKKLPIDEYSMLFIDKEPILEEDGSTQSKPDYSCVCVKNGLVQNVWAIKKIRGSENENKG